MKSDVGRAMVQADGRRPLTAKPRVRSQAGPLGICVQIGAGAGLTLGAFTLACCRHTTSAQCASVTETL